MTGVDLLVPRVEPLDCGRGCLPPMNVERIPWNRAPDDRRSGDRWLCPHGTAYEVFDPSTHGQRCMFRCWRRLGWLGSWLTRRRLAAQK